MKRLALLLLFVAVGAWGQQYEHYKGKSLFDEVTAQQTKPCAFGFIPKTVFGMPKPAPPTPKKELEDSLNVIPFVATTTGLYYHQVCPYERAIELFGQDRVEYRQINEVREVKVWGDCHEDETPTRTKTNECTKFRRQILVDGEVVYEEPVREGK